MGALGTMLAFQAGKHPVSLHCAFAGFIGFHSCSVSTPQPISVLATTVCERSREEESAPTVKQVLGFNTLRTVRHVAQHMMI